MKHAPSAPISDADFNAVRALAAEGRPIPAIVMAALVERIEAQAQVDEPELEARPQPA